MEKDPEQRDSDEDYDDQEFQSSDGLETDDDLDVDDVDIENGNDNEDDSLDSGVEPRTALQSNRIIKEPVLEENGIIRIDTQPIHQGRK
ncbi:hypothetical protein THARTR1_09371 [Trichoderma harzianum]|uniref:Uncharacterized protein n=1 Tax=Trichoderma harzianum TaxID=5544 RepID=A0A2K0TWH7_TRIHA|nr:hypothetical protein THARTR1_09371 [Trichoderma harzianum]